MAANARKMISTANGIDMGISYGVYSVSIALNAVQTLNRLAYAEDIDAALEAEITKLEVMVATTGDYAAQARFNYTLDTLKAQR